MPEKREGGREGRGGVMMKSCQLRAIEEKRERDGVNEEGWEGGSSATEEGERRGEGGWVVGEEG